MTLSPVTEPNGRKTERSYWNSIHATAGSSIKMRLPRPIGVDFWNFQLLMRQRLRRGMKVLEIGFAPGKYLAWVAKVLGVAPSGLDYAPEGVRLAEQLFGALGLHGDLRCEDVFATSFEPGTFDFVYSLGVVEHFDDPRAIVRRHVELVRPGGVALVVVPNYGGMYGRLQRWADPENLAIHNLDIMSPSALSRLAPPDLTGVAEAFAFGKMSPWLVSWDRRLPRRLSTPLAYLANFISLAVPFQMSALRPSLVLQITRR